MPPKKKPVQKELTDSEQVITEAALVSVENSIAPIGDKDKLIDDPVVQDLPKPQKKGPTKKQKKPVEIPQKETEDIEQADSDVVEEQVNKPVEEVLPNPSKKTLAKRNKKPVNDAKASKYGLDDEEAGSTEDTVEKELDKENVEDLKPDDKPAKMEKSPRRGAKRGPNRADGASSKPVKGSSVAESASVVETQGINEEPAKDMRRGARRDILKIDDAQRSPPLETLAKDEESDDIPAGRVNKETDKGGKTDESLKKKEKGPARIGAKRAQKTDDASDEAAETPSVNDDLAKEDVKSHPTGDSKNPEKVAALRRGGKRGAQKADDAPPNAALVDASDEAAETPSGNDDLAKGDVKSHPTGDSKKPEKVAVLRRGGKRVPQKADDAPPSAALVDASDEAAETPSGNDDLAKGDVKSHPTGDSKKPEKVAVLRRGGKRVPQKADDAPPSAALVDASDEAAETPSGNDDLAKEDVKSHPTGDSKKPEKVAVLRRGGKRVPQKADDAPPNAALVDASDEAAETPSGNDDLAKEDVKSHPTGDSKKPEKVAVLRRGGKRVPQKADDAPPNAALVDASDQAAETPSGNDDLAKGDVKSDPTGDSKKPEKVAVLRRGGKRVPQKADDAPPNAALVDASDQAAETPSGNDDLAKGDVKSDPTGDSKKPEKVAVLRRGGKRVPQKADDAPPNAALVDASDEAAETPSGNDDLAKEDVKSHPTGDSKNPEKAPRRGGKRGAQNGDNAPANSVSDENDSGHSGPSRPRRGDRKDVQTAKAAPKPEHDASGDEASNGSDESFQEEKVAKKKKRGKAKGDKGVKENEPGPDEKKPKLDEEINYDCEKTNKAGEKWNLKISTWNVAGLRAWVKKNGMDYVKEEDADIMCFQETKCPENKVPPEAKIEGYHTFWASGKKDGYAGVALYSKEQPLKVSYGINNKEHDEEGRVITAEYEKFYLVTTYVPNSGQGLKTLPKRMDWDKIFQNYLKDLDAKKPVILCGDLNVAHEEIDLANPKTNTKSAGFTKEERENMTVLLKEGFVDSFRQLYPGKTGCYTFWTYMGNARSRNTGWRLDYFVVSERLMDSVCDVVIRNKVLGSDHCPTTLFIHV